MSPISDFRVDESFKSGNILELKLQHSYCPTTKTMVLPTGPNNREKLIFEFEYERKIKAQFSVLTLLFEVGGREIPVAAQGREYCCPVVEPLGARSATEHCPLHQHNCPQKESSWFSEHPNSVSAKT